MPADTASFGFSLISLLLNGPCGGSMFKRIFRHSRQYIGLMREPSCASVYVGKERVPIRDAIFCNSGEEKRRGLLSETARTRSTCSNIWSLNFHISGILKMSKPTHQASIILTLRLAVTHRSSLTWPRARARILSGRTQPASIQPSPNELYQGGQSLCQSKYPDTQT